MRSPFRSPAALILTLALPLAGCMGPRWSAGSGAPLTPDQRLPNDSSVRVTRLQNGLTIYVRANAEPRGRAELRLVVNAGSVLEDEGQRGLAHFVEHMAFNGTRRFAAFELVNYLERVGMRFGPDVNAYTGFDETVYMLTLPTDSAGVLETGLDILEDWADGVGFDPEEVRREKGVIIEEWRLGRGAGQRLQDRHLGTLFRSSRYARRLPIGDTTIIRRADAEALRRFYRTWYRPDLMAVVAVGDFDAARVESMIRTRFEDLRMPEHPRTRLTYPVPPSPDTRFSVATDPEAISSTVSIVHIIPSRIRRTVGEYREGIVQSLFGSVLHDRLNETTQQPGAAFIDVSSVSGPLVRTADAYYITARVPDGGTERGLAGLLTEAERAARHGITRGEMDRARRQLLRDWEQIYRERSRATSSQFASQYAGHFLYGGPLLTVDTEYALLQALVPTVSAGEVSSRARAWLDRRNRTVQVSAPERRGGVPPDTVRLAQIVDSVARAQLSPYRDAVSSAPLLAARPAGGSITREERIPEVGVTRWTLSNGVRVVLRPSDFRADEVMMVAYSPGGTSLLRDEDHLYGLTASAAAQVGGLGALSVVELGKRLAGRTASVGAEVGPSSESLSGFSSPGDMELMLELTYLYFTAARRDSTAWEAYRERARESFRDRGLAPEGAFVDTVVTAVTQGHPRARPLTAARVDSLDLDRSLEIFRDRFADASDFTFYLVGSFNPDSIRPLVERYLGSLPATGRREAPRDLGIRSPTGVVRRTVRRGMEPQARTQVVFTGPISMDRRNVSLLRTLGAVLELRLRDRLREDLSGTYGVGVLATTSPEPRPEFRLSVDFAAAPDRVDDLARVLLSELDSVRTRGVSAEDLAKVREQQRRERELQLRENSFWLSQLVQYDRLGWDVRALLEPPMSQVFTPADLREAAQRFLDPQRYVQVSLYPERVAGPR